MKKTINYPLIIALFSLLFYLPTAKADDEKRAANTTVDLPASRNQVIKFTDKGLVPSSLKIKKEDSIVFFLNDTTGSLTSLQIDFGEKATHCGGAKLQTGRDGKVTTSRPFGPNDFTSTCFHETGEYPFTVYGLQSNPQGVKSSVIVE